MRTHFRIINILLTLCLVTSCSTLSRTNTYGIEEKNTQRIALQSPEIWTLPNGLTVIFFEDNELPVISGKLYMKGGTLYEGVDKFAVSDVMGAMMRFGGAGKYSADELDKVLNLKAAGISSAFGDEVGSVEFTCLSKDLEEIFQIFTEVVLSPRFEENRLDLWKGQAKESILRRKEDPSSVAGIAYQQLIFGETPLGRVRTSSDVSKMNRELLKKEYKRFVSPKDAILTISGDSDKEKISSLVEKYFRTWNQSKIERGTITSLEYKPQGGLYFINLPFEQATIYEGTLGPKRLSPDYIAIEGFNEIFGAGGFSSRLMKRVRSELGFAYSVFGSILPGPVKGKNIIVIQTKAKTAGDALAASLDELMIMRNKEPSEVEVNDTKRSIENSFVFKFDSTEKVADRSALLRILEYPKNYDSTYLNKVHKMQGKDILKVAQSRWSLDSNVAVVVGNDQALASIKTMLASRSDLKTLFPLIEIGFDEKLYGKT